MATMQLADTSKLTGKNQELLTQFEKNMGMIPNILKQMANSPATLEGFLLNRESLSKGLFDGKMAALVGIVIGETYSCEYLLAARVAAGKKAGLTEDEIKLAKDQTSNDPKVDAGLQFVRNLVLRHAEVAPSDLAELKTVGYTDGEIVELIAHACQTLFVYYLIQIAEPVLDFPEVPTAFPA
jgi:alkylhydroperoxidase/carboxymuconolactone decarboxylase family protein YurZ